MTANKQENSLTPFLASKPETGKLLGGICIRTVENLIACKDLDARKVRGRTMVTMASIRRLASRDVPPPSPAAKRNRTAKPRPVTPTGANSAESHEIVGQPPKGGAGVAPPFTGAER